MNPRVSVIIPAFNHGALLGEALDSILSQTFCDWEALIVDDGSTDNTANVVKRFDDPRLKYMFQPRLGVSQARNLGIDSSRGEYVAFLDADDLFHREWLAALVTHLDAHPKA